MDAAWLAKPELFPLLDCNGDLRAAENVKVNQIWNKGTKRQQGGRFL